MCCSNDTAAATGIFTPHLEISAFPPPPFCFGYLLFFRIYSIHPKPQLCASARAKNRLDRIHAAEIHQCTIAPQLHAASTNKEGKEKKFSNQRSEEPDYLQRAESSTHRQQLCGSLVIR